MYSCKFTLILRCVLASSPHDLNVSFSAVTPVQVYHPPHTGIKSDLSFSLAVS